MAKKKSDADLALEEAFEEAMNGAGYEYVEAEGRKVIADEYVVRTDPDGGEYVPAGDDVPDKAGERAKDRAFKALEAEKIKADMDKLLRAQPGPNIEDLRREIDKYRFAPLPGEGEGMGFEREQFDRNSPLIPNGNGYGLGGPDGPRIIDGNKAQQLYEREITEQQQRLKERDDEIARLKETIRVQREEIEFYKGLVEGEQ